MLQPACSSNPRQLAMQDTPTWQRPRRLEPPFNATNLFRRALRSFYAKVPVQTNRRQLRYFPETFTGKEALDCMETILPDVFDPSKCNRTKAKNLLQMFIKWRCIMNARDEESRELVDNATLYRFSKQHVEEVISEPLSYSMHHRASKVDRASSMRESNSNFLNKDSIISHAAAPKAQFDSDDSPLLSNQLDGRLSISCQDINMIEREKHNKTKSTLANFSGLMGSIGRAGANLFSLNRSNSECNQRRPRDQTPLTTRHSGSNPKALCDSVLRDKGNLLSERYIAHIGPTKKSVFHVAGQPNLCRLRLAQPNNQQQVPVASASSVFTEADEFKFWRAAIETQIGQILGRFGAEQFLPSGFSGADVRWNCTRVNARTGIVNKISDQMQQLGAGKDNKLNALFCVLGELPRDFLCAMRRLCQWGDQTREAGANGPLQNDDAADLEQLYRSIRAQLARLASIVPAEYAHCLHNIMARHGKPTAAHSAESTRRRVLLSVRLCTLSFVPQVLRNLQTIGRALALICANPTLRDCASWMALQKREEDNKLEGGKTDCHFLIREFSSLVFAPTEQFPASDCAALLNLLVLNLNECLILVPKWLKEDVQRAITAHCAKAALSPSEVIPSTSFCDRIDKNTYNEQSKSADQHLVELLDQIAGDENLSEAQKFDKLKMFRVAHPSIYAMRYPAPTSNGDSLLEQPQKEEKRSLIRNVRKVGSN